MVLTGYGSRDFAHYVCGIEVDLRALALEGAGAAKLTVWTVENREHKRMCYFSLDPATGAFVKGCVNCFALGWMDADQEYFDELIGELFEREKQLEWDEIKAF